MTTTTPEENLIGPDHRSDKMWRRVRFLLLSGSLPLRAVLPDDAQMGMCNQGMVQRTLLPVRQVDQGRPPLVPKASLNDTKIREKCLDLLNVGVVLRKMRLHSIEEIKKLM